MVGTRLVLKYTDQNEGFARLLPRTGTIIETLHSTSDDTDWVHIELDEPLDYQMSQPLEFPVKIVHCASLLIRSRVSAQEIGRDQEVDVFVRLVPDERQIHAESFDAVSFPFVAWGTCSIS